MRLLWLLTIFLATKNATAVDRETKEYLDLSDIEDSSFMWKHLFIKLNTVLSETEALGLGLANVNERLDDLNKRQEQHSIDIGKLKKNITDIRQDFDEKNNNSKNGDEQTNLADSTGLKMMTNRFNMLWKSIIPVNTSERLEKSKKVQERIWESEMSANKRLDAIKERLEILWETEMRANTNFRLEEIKFQLDKFWKSVAEVRPNKSRPWKTILRRQDGSVDFNRNWTDYKHGFGHDNGEFFIGLEALHKLTSQGPPQELLVILQDFLIETRYAKYDLFRIGNEAEKYALTELGTYSGDVGDSLREHKGCNFTTLDQDNAGYSSNCASFLYGGWWFLSTFCKRAFLTGPYTTEFGTGSVTWDSWHNKESMSYAEMLIRSKN